MDASAHGLGYVLSQKDHQGEEHPIAYASKKLLPSGKKNYSAIEREALVIVKGVKCFMTYFGWKQVHDSNGPQPAYTLGKLQG